MSRGTKTSRDSWCVVPGKPNPRQCPASVLPTLSLQHWWGVCESRRAVATRRMLDKGVDLQLEHVGCWKKGSILKSNTRQIKKRRKLSVFDIYRNQNLCFQHVACWKTGSVWESNTWHAGKKGPSGNRTRGCASDVVWLCRSAWQWYHVLL